MRRLTCVMAAVVAAAGLLATGPADADVRVRISKSSQKMTVWVDGYTYAVWPVSTGRRGYSTPSGTFRPHRLEPRWFSRKYDMAPMHNAIFYRGGYAIHGTSHVGQLGRPASHGCVRLHPSNARALFSLVRSHGLSRTRITITH